MPGPDEPPLRFCPFCRDPYEGVDRCPEHELPLVPFEKLPPARRERGEDEPLPLHALVAGRGWLLLAALALLLAPALPWVEVTLGGRTREASGYALAMGRAVNAWIVPAVGLAWLLVLRRYRTARALRSARLAVGLLAPLPAASGWLTWQRVLAGVERARGAGVEGAARPGWGLALLAAGVLLGLVAAARLGRLPRR